MITEIQAVGQDVSILKGEGQISLGQGQWKGVPWKVYNNGALKSIF